MTRFKASDAARSTGTQAPATTGGNPSSDWHRGWYAAATALPSPNFGPRPQGTAISLIVVHSISLPPGQYGNGAIQSLFSNRLAWDSDPYFRSIRGLQVSSHFVITRNGALWQFVSCDARAWHAGVSSFEGRANCNDFSTGIELEGLEGTAFEDRQYDTLAATCLALRARYPIRAVTGHEDIAPGRKTDPGCGFDWHDLQRRVRWPAELFHHPRPAGM